MDQSVFLDKMIKPTNSDLVEKLDLTFYLWKLLYDYVMRQYPNGVGEWNFSGQKYGWSYRIKDKKRAIIYLLPREKYFKVAFVFGQNATDHIMDSDINQEIKEELSLAKKYAEGRGIRIPVNDNSLMDDLKKLIDIKLMY